MSQAVWSAVDRYFEERLLGSDDVLDHALTTSTEAALPVIAVSPSQGKLLYLLAAGIRAGSILEIGTLGGYSAIWMGRALREGGRMVSLEAEARHAEVAKLNLAKAGLSEKVEIWIGQALDLLPRVAAAGGGPFDFTFIDADKGNIPEYFDWAVKLSRPGAMIVVDNVVRSGEVLDRDSASDDIGGIRRFTEMIAGDNRVTATTIQTVGSKGHDGFTLAIVRSDG